MEAVWRGLRRKCPRCGEGALFRRWFSLHTECAVCKLRFEEQPGDTWALWIFTDRVFLFVIIAALCFGFTPESWWIRGCFFAAVGGLLVATMPHRQGAFIALDYMARTHWR